MTMHDQPEKGKGGALLGASTSLRLYPSGTLFTPFEPRPEDIHIEDVAHALSRIGRFGEHTAKRHNVAHHSLIVADLMDQAGASRDAILWGLLHEVAEALSGLGDACGPTKRHPSLVGPIKALEHGIERAASVRFGLPFGFASAAVVKRADNIVPMGCRRSRICFLERFDALGGRR